MSKPSQFDKGMQPISEVGATAPVLKRLEVMEDIEEGIQQANFGLGIAQSEVKQRLLAKYKP